MEPNIYFKQLEKKTASAVFQTGIVEIGIGLIFLVSSLAMIFDDYSYYIDILLIVPVFFIVLGVKYIVNPRMGTVIPSKRRVRKSRFLAITITTFLVIMLTLTIVGKTNNLYDYINPRLVISAIVFIICIAIAYFLSFDRMYIYAFLLTGSFNLSEEIRENNWIISEGGYAYLFASTVLAAVGCVYLIRFLKKFPLPYK